MNIVDQKIEHLHYLYEKRVNHTLKIKTEILKIQNQIKEKDYIAEQEILPLYDRKSSIKFHFQLGGVLIGFICGQLVEFLTKFGFFTDVATIVVTITPLVIATRLVKKIRNILISIKK